MIKDTLTFTACMVLLIGIAFTIYHFKAKEAREEKQKEKQIEFRDSLQVELYKSQIQYYKHVIQLNTGRAVH